MATKREADATLAFFLEALRNQICVMSIRVVGRVNLAAKQEWVIGVEINMQSPGLIIGSLPIPRADGTLSNSRVPVLVSRRLPSA